MKLLKSPDSVPDIICLDDFKLGYIPIAKAGCSSFKYRISKVLKLDIPKKMVHSSVPKEKIFQKSNYPDYFIFSFVRNPFSRILSAYKSKIFGYKYDNKSVSNGVHKILTVYYGDTFYGGMTFKQYVKAVSQIPDHIADEHFRSLSSFLFDHEGNKMFDFVGKLETIDQDFKELKKLTEVPIEEIDHFGNNTVHKHYSRYYDDEMIELIKKRYAQDFINFDYSYENKSPKVFTDPIPREYKIEAKVLDKNRIKINFEIWSEYDYRNVGKFFVQLALKDSEDSIKKINITWDMFEKNNNGVTFSTTIDEIENINRIYLGHYFPKMGTNLWSRMYSIKDILKNGGFS